MRLVSVIHGPGYGGAHNQLLRLAKPLRDQHEIETVAVLPTEAATPVERFEAAGIETIQLPLSRLRASRDPRVQARFLRGLPGDVRALEQTIRELGGDVVQVHGPTNPQAAIAARRGGVGVVWQLLDTRAPLIVRRAAVPAIARMADRVTVWGEALIAAHPGIERLGGRVTVVYPPVDMSAFAPDSGRRDRARMDLNLDADVVAVGAVAAINPQKGLDRLIDATAGAGSPTAIRILGEPGPAHGAELARLERLGKRLNDASPGRFEIRNPGDRVAELVQALDVFVLASVKRSEGMPTAILEAMAAGKPVVATNVGAVSELVEHGHTGLLVDPDDPAALREAIGRLVNDAAMRARMGSAGREEALRRFDLDRLADRHAAVYTRAAARQKRNG